MGEPKKTVWFRNRRSSQIESTINQWTTTLNRTVDYKIRFDGRGMLTVDVISDFIRTSFFDGAGTLLASRMLTKPRVAAFDGSGAIEAGRRIIAQRTGSFEGSGELALGAPRFDFNRLVGLSGVGQLTVNTLISRIRQAGFAGSGDIVANRILDSVRVAALDGDGVLGILYRLDSVRTAGLDGSGSLTGTRTLGSVRTAAMTGSGVIDAVRTYIQGNFFSQISGDLASGDYYNKVLLRQPNITSGDVVAHYSLDETSGAFQDSGPNAYHADAFTGNDFPCVVGLGGWASTNADNVALPITYDVGDLLLIFVAGWSNFGTAPDFVVPDGWELILRKRDSTEKLLGIIGRVADGTEAATLDMSLSSTQDMATLARAVTGWGGSIANDIEVADAGPSTGNPNPPSLTASWGSDKNLWFAACMGDENNSDLSVSDPTNFIGQSTARSGTPGGDGATCAIAWRKVEAATVDPDTMSIGTPATNVSATMVIRPPASYDGYAKAPAAWESTGSALFGYGNSTSLGANTRFDYIHNTATFAISLWVRELSNFGDLNEYRSDQGNATPLFILGSTASTGTDQGFFIRTTPSQWEAGYSVSTGTSATITGAGGARDDNPANEPTHLCLVGRGTSMEFYVNGASVGSATISSNTGSATRSVEIGDDPTGTNNPWTGYIDEVSFLDVSLTSDEVRMLYESGSGYTRPQQFLAHYSFDEVPSNYGIIREADLQMRLVFTENSYSDAGTTVTIPGAGMQEWHATHGSYIFDQTTTTDQPSEELYGVRFDGVDDHLTSKTAINSGELDIGTGDATVLVWVKHNRQEVATILDFRDTGTGSNGWRLATDGFDVLVDIYDGATTYGDSALAPVSKTWSLFGFVVRRSDFTLTAIADGDFSVSPTSIGGEDFSWNSASFSPFIGQSSSDTNHLDGKIAEILYYNVALTQEEVHAIARAGGPRSTDYYRNQVGKVADVADVELHLPLTDAQRTPDEILGTKLKHWWDFSDQTTLWQDTGATRGVWGDNQTIARIDDKIGGMNLTEKVAGVTWDEATGAGDFATAAMSGTFPSSITAPYSVVSVFHPDTTAEQIIHGDTDQGSYLVINYLATAGDHRILTGGTGQTISSQPTTTRMLTELNTKSGNDEYFVNGTSVYSSGDTGDEAPEASDEWNIGDDAGASNNYYDGIFCEQLIIEGTLTADERAELYGYLASKWEIADMDDNSDVYFAESPWTPRELGSKLWAWWDPADPATVTLDGSSFIEQIDDKSGNARNLVDQGTPAISLVADDSGLPVVQSDNSTTNYLLYAEGDDISGIADIYAFFDTAADVQWVGIASPSTSDYIWAALDGSGVAAIDSDAGTPSYYIDGSSVAPISRNEAHDFSTGRRVWGATGLTLGASWTDIRPFAYPNASWVYAGQWGDVIATSSTLTTDERQRVEGYLAHKYRLAASLPGGHPYKTSPPTTTRKFYGAGYIRKQQEALIESASVKTTPTTADCALVGNVTAKEFDFLHQTGDWTIAFWIFIDDDTQTSGYILNNNARGTGEGIEIKKGSGDIDCRLEANSLGYTTTIQYDNINDVRGVFCIFTNNNGTITAYAQGQSSGSVVAATSTNNAADPLTLFAGSDTLASSLHDSRISHLTILNKGISASEATDWFNTHIVINDSAHGDTGVAQNARIGTGAIVDVSNKSKSMGGFHTDDTAENVNFYLGHSIDWGSWVHAAHTFGLSLWTDSFPDYIEYSLDNTEHTILTNRIQTGVAGFSAGIITDTTNGEKMMMDLYRSNDTLTRYESHHYSHYFFGRQYPLNLIWTARVESDEMHFFINGLPMADRIINGVIDVEPSASPVIHGDSATDDVRHAICNLDEVSFTRNEISEREAMELFVKGAPDFIQTLYYKSTLWYRWWDFRNGSDQFVADDSRSAPRLHARRFGTLTTQEPNPSSGWEERLSYYSSKGISLGLNSYFSPPGTLMGNRWLLDNDFTVFQISDFDVLVENMFEFRTDTSGYIRVNLSTKRIEVSDGTTTVNGVTLTEITTAGFHRYCMKVDWAADEVTLWIDGIIADVLDISTVDFTGHLMDNTSYYDQKPQGDYFSFALFVGADDATLTDAERANL